MRLFDTTFVQRMGINNVYIAATAVNYNLTLVTRNKSHFEKIKGLNLEGY